ncbi:MAG: dihydroxyacetone kinase subunit L [Acidimicrobiia bacterium]|nr:dihydroxyacetone kinase subunit L [Acidimicrobiia bacterium]
MLDQEMAKELIRAARHRVGDRQDELSRLDAVAGDGDHGVNMATALGEATERIDGLIDPTPAEVFRTTGRAFHDAVGGAAGALFGAFFGAIGGQLNRSGNPAAPTDLAVGMEKGLARVMRIGRVEQGQKTMVDALSPAVEAARIAEEEGASLAGMLSATARAARQGAASTASMEPRAGRARYAAEQSIGTEDPGACTVALIFEAWAETAMEELDR